VGDERLGNIQQVCKLLLSQPLSGAVLFECFHVAIITMRNCSSQAGYYTASIPDLAPPEYDAGMENWRDRFKARFEYLKRTEGLTQPKLAEKVGVSQPTIST